MNRNRAVGAHHAAHGLNRQGLPQRSALREGTTSWAVAVDGEPCGRNIILMTYGEVNGELNISFGYW